jgi:DNA replicative helicase MCM subunit Mcm2 (Cdc46/Mcm family)
MNVYPLHAKMELLVKIHLICTHSGGIQSRQMHMHVFARLDTQMVYVDMLTLSHKLTVYAQYKPAETAMWMLMNACRHLVKTGLRVLTQQRLQNRFPHMHIVVHAHRVTQMAHALTRLLISMRTTVTYNCLSKVETAIWTSTSVIPHHVSTQFARKVCGIILVNVQKGSKAQTVPRTQMNVLAGLARTVACA